MPAGCSGRTREIDVVALYTSDGIPVGTYSYDPYGGITEISHNDNFKDYEVINVYNDF